MKYINTIHPSRRRKIVSTLFAVFLLASYALVVFAVPPSGGYQPGQTLDPDCNPGDGDCIVTAETLTFDSPLSKTGSIVSIPAASSGIDGYLSASDWNRFDDKQDSFGSGTSFQYLRGDNTWQTLNTSVVPESGNLYWTNGRFDTRLSTATSVPNLQIVGTIISGVWNGSQITDAYISNGITASNYIPLTQKGAADGVATLDGSGKVPSSQLSSFSLSDTFVVNSEVEMLALVSAELGDVAIRLDENKSYILTTNDPTNVANWQQIITPLDFVLSVNGQYGAVNLTTTDIAEGLNLYYTDARVDDYLNTVKGVANGIASLDANGKIPTSQLGSIILNETRVVADIPEMLAITGALNGDLTVVTSTSQTYVLADDNDPSDIDNWVEIVNGSPVTSVNGQVGTVSLTTTNISEGSNQYFTNTRARGAFSATGPLTYNSTTGVLGITQSGSGANGYLSAVDWNTFNDKQDALTFGTVTASLNPEITITGGTGAVIGGGLDIVIPDASDAVRGLITTGTQNFAGIKTFADGIGVGDDTPSELFSVGVGGLFQVDETGDIVKIKNISYAWPSIQGSANDVLVNDGTGVLSWSSNGLLSLNGLTDAAQLFATSTDGSDFSISSSGDTHTFNFPTASDSARGALSSSKYTEFNDKPFVDTTYNNITTLSLSGGTVLDGGNGGANNILLGYQAGSNITTGSNNIILGYQAGKGVTTGVAYSTYVGAQAGLNASSAEHAVFVGRAAGSGATSASYSNFIGRSAGQGATGATVSNFIGDNSGYGATTATYSNFLGQYAGYQATGANSANFIGPSTGYQATGAQYSNFIGRSAGYQATTAEHSNFFGRLAGYTATASSYSNFFGYQAGSGASQAANSIFIGKNAGLNDTVNNTVSGSSIAIGDSAGTGGFSNSIALGASAVNTSANQLLIGSSYTKLNVRGIDYTWPSAQAVGSGYALTNDGSGNLSWAPNLAIGGSSGELQYNNAGALGGVTGISFDGTNFDAKDSVFRIVDNADTTKRAIFEVSGIDTGTTRTYTLPNTAGTLALAADLVSLNYLTTNGTSYNTFLSAMKGATAFTSGTSNTLIGYQAGYNLTSGTYNNLFGFNAGYSLSTTSNNNMMGYNAGFQAVVSNSNFFGAEAGAGSASASTSNFLGPYAGSLATNANNSNFFGNLSGRSATNAANSNFFGSSAGIGATNAAHSNFFGYGAGYNASASANSVFIGQSAGHTATTAPNSVFIGQNAGRNATGALESIFIGKDSGYNAVSTGVTGGYNIGLGTDTGKALTSGIHNTLLGYQSGIAMTNSSYNVAIGYRAGYTGLSGGFQSNVFIGREAGSTAGSLMLHSILMGYQAGNSSNAGYSIGIGYQAIANTGILDRINGIGYLAGNGATNGNYSFFAGASAGYQATGASYVFFGGQEAGFQASASPRSVFVGQQAGYGATTAPDSVFLGDRAGRNATGAAFSIIIGKDAGYNSTGSGITGDYNILLGYQAGDNITTGEENVLIGRSIDAQSATASGQLSIQNIIFGTGNTGTGTTVSTGKIGIGVSPSSYRFEVSDASNAGAISSFTNSDGTCTLDPGDVSGWSCPSDLNLKKDIQTLTSGSLDNILALRPVAYRLINEDNSVNLSTGLIAQEVQTVFPTLVKTQIDGTLALNYGGLTPYMISAIQEMNLQITEINDNDKPNSWRDALIAWFANTANGITEFFSKKVSTEQLCVTDSAGQTCITRSQLDALLNGQGVQTNPAPEPTPDPDPVPDPETDENVVPDSTPDPDPVPDSTPGDDSGSLDTSGDTGTEPAPEPSPDDSGGESSDSGTGDSGTGSSDPAPSV